MSKRPMKDWDNENCWCCNQPGHIARDCPHNQRSGDDLQAPKRYCFRCHSYNHESWNCTNRHKFSWLGPDRCWNCGQRGHTSTRCPEPYQQHKNPVPKHNPELPIYKACKICGCRLDYCRCNRRWDANGGAGPSGLAT